MQDDLPKASESYSHLPAANYLVLPFEKQRVLRDTTANPWSSRGRSLVAVRSLTSAPLARLVSWDHTGDGFLESWRSHDATREPSCCSSIGTDDRCAVGHPKSDEM